MAQASPHTWGCVWLAVCCACALPADKPEKNEKKIAENEDAAVAACKTYAEAQDIYRRSDWDRDGILEYAQTILGNDPVRELEPERIPAPREDDAAALAPLLKQLASENYQERENASAGIEKLGPSVIRLLDQAARDEKDAEVQHRCRVIARKLKAPLMPVGLDTRFGLFQTEHGSADLQLVDQAFADAAVGPPRPPKPKAGYFFKLLAGQGPDAPAGRKSYLIPRGDRPAEKNMTIGYALVAWPAVYGETGRHTFQINNTGTVYMKDLGPETAKIAEAMTEYNFDKTWEIAP